MPSITFKRRAALSWTLGIVTFLSALAWILIARHHYRVPLGIPLLWAAPVFGLRAFGWLASCFDRPHQARTPEDRARLDAMRVVVSVPLYNENPALLDRCLWALVNQTRPPDRIDVVDDHSTKVDYTEMQEFWVGQHGRTQVTWHRQPVNQGKRRAHCVTVTDDTEADIIVTIDSDTTIVHNGIEEIIKPFLADDIYSVAGIEMGYNASVNLLTLVQNSLQQVSQAVVSASWSVTGRMLTNRGPFAAYRGEMFRAMVPLYYGETLFGHRIVLGDDSLLALAGSEWGRSVQQMSAFGLTMWPEDLSHHLRQRLRWARGRTVRNFWRLKYYPAFSYLGMFTASSIYSFFAGIVALVWLVSHLPATAGLIMRLLLTMIWLSWLAQLRVLCFSRSDDTWVDRALVIAIRPLASLWASVVLSRILRAIGTVTFLRQGWTTRQQGAELELILDREPEPVKVDA